MREDQNVRYPKQTETPHFLPSPLSQKRKGGDFIRRLEASQQIVGSQIRGGKRIKNQGVLLVVSSIQYALLANVAERTNVQALKKLVNVPVYGPLKFNPKYRTDLDLLARELSKLGLKFK